MKHLLPLVCLLLLWSPDAVQAGDDPAALMDEAFEAAQWGFISSAGSAIRQMAQRRAAGDGAQADLLRQRQSLEDLRRQAESRLATLGDTATGPEVVRLSGEIAGLGAEIAALDTQAVTAAPADDRLTRPQPLSVAQVQALLAPDEGLLFLFSGENDSYGWAITADTAAWHRVGIGSGLLGDQIATIRASLSQEATLRSAAPLGAGFARPAVQPFDRTGAALLYWEHVEPLMPFLTGVRHLYTVVDGPLTGLPLSLLVTDMAPGGDDDPETLRSTGWLFQNFAMTTLPSVESLGLIRSRDRRMTGGTYAFLGFGDPALGGQVQATSVASVMRAGVADADSIRALAPLPNTARELRRIAATLGAADDRLYLGLAATETALKAAPLAKADVIAFATHGLLSGDLEGLAEPALVLSPPDTATAGDDGLLTASEIAALPLDADWVVLSACNTAGSDGQPDAEGLSGLARAFLFAGARSIMVSHWPVRDDAAARLTTDTFAALAGPDPARRKSEALQRAMQAMLADPTDPTLAHPAAWAPFVLVGDGG
jgi:CHAT domain-containing protein